MAIAFAPAALADGGVTFTDIADSGGAGLSYLRQASPRADIRVQTLAGSPYTFGVFFSPTGLRGSATPQKGGGSPGVAIFDYDGDGDLDIYVTNGPGAGNSLFQNQGGAASFVDVAAAAGVDAFDQDSAGVCFGDLDNDGDHDLYVLGTGEPNRLFENLGNGTFGDVTATAGVGGGNRHPVGCTMLDADNDGLLDIAVGNSYDNWDHRITVFGPGTTYAFMEHNQLFMNQGGIVFSDESNARGIENVVPLTGVPGTTGAAFTWAIGSADYDLDGDVDIFSMDNQGPAPASLPDDARGYIRIFNNDGAGNFTDVSIAAGTNVLGGWMGVDFGDFNCDGHMDFFGTDLGYLGLAPSRWFLANGDGTFADSGGGDLLMTPFGWGVSVFDYDNDADADVIYHGGVDITNIVVLDNPGTLLTNSGTCSADFDYDAAALLKDHRRRLVEGVAVGDLDGDGFEDIVSVSGSDVEAFFELPVAGVFTPPTGSVFDAIARAELMMSTLTIPGSALYINQVDGAGLPKHLPGGTLAVEINSGDNGNGFAEFTVVGSPNPGTANGVNRDGIGAVVFFTPDGGPTSMRPVVGGASYSSQDALAANFGMASATGGVVEVLWPGGVRNRLDDVVAGEKLVLPYIPCSFDANWKNFGQFNSCVQQALNEHKAAGTIDAAYKNRLRDSMRRAFDDAQ